MRKLCGNVINAEYIRGEFPSDSPALKYIDGLRWGGNPVCPYCNSGRGIGRGHRAGWHRCNNHRCKRCFTSKHGTIFENSLIPLRKWFMGIYYMLRSEGCRASKLRDELGISTASAWHMMHRICMVMGRGKGDMVLSGIVECDKHSFGGREDLKHSKDKLHPGGGQGGKLGVFSMVERGGRSLTFAVPGKPAENSLGEPITLPDFSEEVFSGMIKRHVSPDSIVCTDGSSLYGDLAGGGLALRHFRVMGDESRPAVSDTEIAHIGTVYGRLIALRGSLGNLRGWDRRYFQRCLDAADFRWNETRVFDGTGRFSRRVPTREAFETFIRLCFGMPLDREKVAS